MRLSTIKLAGFKSFVDPTTLHLPTNMSAVVGPNGCGKSNIIDAIRWVMGESAASRLRGGSLADVIFSGSSSRKPVNQAMVELLFDNSDGTIGGEFADYNEISVKRIASRDGQSQYYLNGTRCRRRDITDLFLGTGLGARSYSIIEQGMISQIVESDPEQLRVHLEEAAGISKYKERRKETESRIKSTRENLDRVRDVCDEVDKQLGHLNRQAKAAERWQELKALQVRKEAELKAVTLRAAQTQLAEDTQALRLAELAIEERLAEQREREARIEESREQQHEANAQLNLVQGEVYKVGAEIARVEQQIQHNRVLAEQLQRAHEETERAHAELSEHIGGDTEQVEAIRTLMLDAEPRREAMAEAVEAAAEAVRLAETQLAAWQEQWGEHSKATADASQAGEIERTRLDYLDRQCLEADRRRETLLAEKSAADLEELARALGRLEDDQAGLREQMELLGEALDERRQTLEQLIESERMLQGLLSGKRGELEQSRGRLSSLEALQHAALNESAGAARDWLQRFGLGNARRLGELLEVDSGWETAVETVLQGWLDAVVTDNPARLVGDLAPLRDVDMTLLAQTGDAPQVSAGTLAAHVRGPAAALAVLARVHTATSIDAAHAVLAQLPPQDSVITQQGEWLSAGFARIARAQGAQVGVLARERDISALTARIRQLEAEIEAHAEQLEDTRLARIESERVRDDAQREVYTANRRLAEIAGQVQSQRGRMDSAQERLLRVDAELDELTEKLEADREQAREARNRLEAALTQMGDLEQRRRDLEGERRQLLESREEARMNAREISDTAHRAALDIESRRAALASLEQGLQRMHGQLAQLQARREEIAAQRNRDEDPILALEAERQTCLNQRLLVDKELVEARRLVEECDAALRRLEVERQQISEAVMQQREKLADMRLREQEHALRAESLLEGIVEAGFELESLINELPADIDAGKWQADLADIEQKIRRLEPVNLAAIQEYEEQSQRKTYLDAQINDLTTAMETLEGAIRKIDRETRQRFKDTFDRVNSGFQELFPRLFGGGQAYLELTGDDLLSTGVGIMARPPGKRVSSISLLSGGEKAMTAVALVFSIFRLNPAPFCLLDEVDAPLDEANVGRFSAMVDEMSEHVQFIIVTHNKSTMEASKQLCGVTMREPGVSRLVQVDLAEATKLVGAA